MINSCFLFCFLFARFHFIFSSNILYYQRFNDNDYYPPGYDYNYCGSSESWPQSDFSGGVWNNAELIASNNFVGWGGWSDSLSRYSYNNDLFQKCAGETIFGGYGYFGKSISIIKNFINLPNHYYVEVEIKLYQFDSWDGEYFYLYLDSTSTSTLILYQYFGIDWLRDYCGNGSPSSYSITNQYLVGGYYHYDTTLNLIFTSDLDQDAYDESFGFKNLKVYLRNDCHNSCITCSVDYSGTSCLSCPSFANLLGGKCICKDKFYMKSSPYTYCAKCDLSCATCNGGTRSNCKSCYSGYILSSGTCINPSNLIIISTEFTGTFTVSSLDTWSVSGKKIISKQCGPYTLVGGPYNYKYNDYISKTFDLSILPHYQFGVFVDFIKIDNWNNKQFLIKAILVGNEYTIYESEFLSSTSDTVYVRNLCAGCYNEAFLNIYMTYPTTENSVTIKLTTTLESSDTNAYWGINNFQITVFLCHPSCSSCFGSSDLSCSSCYIHATKTVSNACQCDDGYYMKIYNNPCVSYPCSSCELCHSSCKTCFGGTSSSCYSCSDGYYLYLNSCLACSLKCLTCITTNDNCVTCAPEKYLISSSLTSTCDSACPFRYYAEDSSRTCRACESSCEICNGPTSSNCLTCAIGKFIFNNQCVSCDSKCKTCESTSTHCTSCVDDTYLYNYDCISVCPLGFFSRSLDLTCQPCDLSCLTCTGIGYSKCKSCDNGYFLSPSPIGSCLICDLACKTCVSTPTQCTSCNSGRYLYENECKTQCPDGFWPRDSDNTCQNCEPSCTTCSAGTSLDCTKCSDGAYLSLTGECIACTGCKTCVNSAANCLSCDSPSFLNENNCITQCPLGKWPKTSDRACINCENSCKTCTAGTSSDCASCYNGFYLSSGNQCLECSKACKTCVTSASSCLSCNFGSYLSGKNCLSDCPLGQYGDDSSNSCISCDSSCYTCNSPGDSNSCTSCIDGFFLDSGKCSVCSSPCATCETVSTKCTSCSEPYSLFKNSNECLIACSDGYYSSSSACFQCDTSCKTCQGELPSDCTSCPDGTFLSLGRCVPCDSTCLTCNSLSFSDCLSCESSKYLQEGACVEKCKEGYFKTETPKKECIRCSNTCLSCISSNFNDCLTCKDYSYFTLLDKNKLTGSCTYLSCPYSLIMDPETFTCLKQCDAQKYFNKLYNSCKECDTTCKTCSGSSSDDCLSCKSPLFLYENQCVEDCPIKFYGDASEALCKNCSKNCDKCENENKCTSCLKGYFLDTVTFECLTEPVDGGFINLTDGTISTCSTGCLKCDSFPKCLKCDENNFYINKDQICVEKTKIKPILYTNESMKFTFFLTFNASWENFFNNLTQNSSSYDAKIENMDKNSYTLNFGYYRFNSTPNWEIIIEFKNDTHEIQNLSISLFPINEPAFKLIESTVKVEVPLYSVNDTNLSSKDYPLIYVEPLLEYYSMGKNEFKLSFSDNFTDLFVILHNITSISIEAIQNEYYNFKLTKLIYKNIFNLTLEIRTPVLGKPVLTVQFDLPGYIVYHPIYRLTKKNVSINLADFYLFEEDSSFTLEYLENFSNLVYKILILLALSYGLLFLGSLTFFGLETITIINFLRYMNIDFPPQVKIFFENCDFDINLKSYFNFDFNSNENNDNLPLLYKKYGVKTNFLESGFEKLLILLALIIVGCVFKIFSNSLKNNKKIFAKIVEKISHLFFLNTFFLFYFSNLLDLCFFSYINMKYYDGGSVFDKISLLFSILFVLLTALTHFILYKVLLKLNFKNNDSVIKRETVKRKTWWLDQDESNLPNSNDESNNPICFSSTRAPIKIISVPKKNEKINENYIEQKGNNNFPENKDTIENSSILVLKKDFLQVSKTQYLYVLLLMARYAILPVFAMWNKNGYEMGIYFMLNGLFLFYIVLIKPFRSVSLFLINIFLETMIMIALFGALMLNSQQKQNKYNYAETMLYGWMIFYSAMTACIILIIFLGVQIIWVLIEKSMMCLKKKNQIHPINKK